MEEIRIKQRIAETKELSLMMRLISAFAIILACASAAVVAEPAPLNTLHAIRALTNAEASRRFPVAFEATVTFFRSNPRSLYAQDGDQAIWVDLDKDFKLVPGDRILIQGVTESSFRTDVEAHDVTVLRHGNLPKPEPATYRELINIQHLCKLVTILGVIRSADLVPNTQTHEVSARMGMLVDGGEIEVWVDTDDENALKKLLNAEVEITGVAGVRFDGKFQTTGIILHVSTLANVKILHQAKASPWSLPITPMDLIYQAHHVHDFTQRVRVEGSVTYYQPGSAIVLQSGDKSLWIMTRTYSDIPIGDLVDATGFPDLHDGFLTLTGGEVQDNHVQAPIAPLPATWDLLSSSRNIFDLVSIEGRVVTEVRAAQQDEYVLASHGQLFSAIYRHPPAGGQSPLPAMMKIAPGSVIRVTGICILEDSNPFESNASHVSFNILMRSPRDIAIVAGPPLLNVPNLMLLVGLMLMVLVVVGTWGWILERRVRQKTVALAASIEAEAALQRRSAQLEKKRSRILEHINGSQPLAEILEEIAEMISFRLDGVPCWCEVTDGARLGNYPHQLDSLRIRREEIPARSGSPLGSFFAGFGPGTLPGSHEAEALELGARLAALAMETRRLYTDLLHRSEFDQLTDIHNRFSLDKHMDAQINDAREKAGIFGLIYIDLDEFKQVNDLYGHQVGDYYLREVARRMRRQLRSHDLLARLGGDEFAVLVPAARSRAAVEEIAVRLEHSFDEPFAVEGCVIRGSASVGFALYPEDATSRDGLLKAADDAMYAVKNARKQIGPMPANR
jgi:diguanylate cyclase (GGDEF)-like protein